VRRTWDTLGGRSQCGHFTYIPRAHAYLLGRPQVVQSKTKFETQERAGHIY